MSAIATIPPERTGRGLKHGASRLLSSAPTVVPYLLVPIVFLIGGALIPGFIGLQSIRSLLIIASFLGIASIGQTVVILLGGIDLSIPAVIGMADVMATQLYGRGLPFWEVALAIVAAALAIGIANGLVSFLLHAHPLIITLAMNSVVLGTILAITHGQNNGTVPEWLTKAVSPAGHLGGFPLPAVIVIWAVLTALVILFQRRLRLGRWLYATGANPMAARYALVRPALLWGVIFAISAVSAAIGGTLLAGFSGGANSSVGSPYLFTTIAAVVVGGTALVGGRGGYGRTVAGVLLITELTTLLVGVGSNTEVQEMLLGLLIVVMVGVYGRDQHVRTEV